MRIETKIALKKFNPRPYQLDLFRAIENDGLKRALCVWPRRAGKDVAAFNLLIRAALKAVGVYYYIFPTFSQARRVIWDSITNDGQRFMDYIPPELVDRKNEQQMKIIFKNGSIIQLVGSDNYDSLMGTNPRGCIFSEYALQDSRAYQFIRPILTANQGWAVFISTPRGKNHLWELYQIAQQSKEWYYSKLSVNDTHHIDIDEIRKEIASGEISEDLAMQEYYTSFDMGVEGAYYAKYLDRMRTKEQIGIIPHETGFKVHTAWDLGMRDATTIIFFQTIGQTIRVIDCYENAKVGLEHYAYILQEKPYQYGKHIAPHDIKVQELGSGISRIEKARQLGISFTVAPNISIIDGIEAVRSMLSKTYIDQKQCAPLIKALENYRQEFDAKRKVYVPRPLHNWACFTGDTPILTSDGIRPIMDITNRQKVLTKEGWVSCQGARKTGENAKLVEVSFGDGTKVRCTPEHRFLTENGWRSAELLIPSIKIQSSLMKLPNILTVTSIVCGQVKNILPKEESDCTASFGRSLLEKFLQEITSIIKTATPTTAVYQTLSHYLRVSIERYLDPITKAYLRNAEMQPQHGIHPKQEDCGTRDKRSEVNLGLNGVGKKENALSVQENLMPLLERMDMLTNFVGTIANQDTTIISVKEIDERADVYCICVPSVEHFSLINGAIVHNSHFADATRYMAVAMPKTRDGRSAQEIEKDYQEAMYGSSLPYPFN